MRVVFFGTPQFAVASLNAIMLSAHEVVGVVTVADKPSGRGQRMTESDVKRYAVQNDLPLLQPQRLRDPDFLSALRAWNADVFVVVAFRMLPEEVWSMPLKGTFNLHAALLPRYRGAAPINHALINGDIETGVTTFLLNHNIDEGDILMQVPTPISPLDNAETLHDRLADLGRRLVLDTLDGLEKGTLKPRKQMGTPTLAPKIFKNDCRINLNQPTQKVVNFVRGLSPYPGAFVTMQRPDGQMVDIKIYSASATITGQAAVGQLLTDGKEALKLGTADGYICVEYLQMSGKRKNSVADFLRGNKLSGWKLVL
ncbi:MAG: methionyl-tRNA formyltransferase [Bacteroidales bacterium]|nr:methionyl-tRNA formyltransferase [Bacteroidales bacterium]